MATMRIRAGDHVRHRPSDEIWVVAFADYDTGDIAWCGWPEGLARIADCDRIKAASDDEHAQIVAQIILSGGMRAASVKRLYLKGQDIDFSKVAGHAR
ncbi:hypothetical protein [Zavarzinia sp.]|uniref:hypothetical protein n=1 Tax=Zavarzinia sp. TaxID=2027920 RepID=UPI003BB67EAE